MLNILTKRRSVRKYKKTPVEKEKIEKLIQAALLSPSSRNLNPWEFIIVDDKELINQLSKSKEHGSSFLQNTPLAIVIMADPEKCDVWVEDTSIASIIIQLVAESLDLSSCWIQIRKRFHNEKTTSEDFIKKTLTIPEKYKVESIIALGYPDEEKIPHNIKKLQYEKVFINKYNKKYLN